MVSFVLGDLVVVEVKGLFVLCEDVRVVTLTAGGAYYSMRALFGACESADCSLSLNVQFGVVLIGCLQEEGGMG